MCAPTTEELGQLASAVPDRTLRNETPIPDGWTRLDDHYARNNFLGSTAGAYKQAGEWSSLMSRGLLRSIGVAMAMLASNVGLAEGRPGSSDHQAELEYYAICFSYLGTVPSKLPVASCRSPSQLPIGAARFESTSVDWSKDDFDDKYSQTGRLLKAFAKYVWDHDVNQVKHAYDRAEGRELGMPWSFWTSFIERMGNGLKTADIDVDSDGTVERILFLTDECGATSLRVPVVVAADGESVNTSKTRRWLRPRGERESYQGDANALNAAGTESQEKRSIADPLEALTVSMFQLGSSWYLDTQWNVGPYQRPAYSDRSLHIYRLDHSGAVEICLKP